MICLGLIITSTLNLSEQLDLSFPLSQTTTCQSSSLRPPSWGSQLALLLPWDAKLEAIGPVLLVDLDPVVVGVGYDDLLLQAEAEPMRRVELPKLAADLHRVELNRRKV